MGSISQEIIIIAFASIFVIFIFTSIISMVLTYQKKQIKFLKEKEHMKMMHDNELLQTQIEIQEQTLHNISQEIHDNIGQVLSLAKLNLNNFKQITDPVLLTRIDDTRHLVSKAIVDLRDLSKSLYGDKIAEIGLQNAIANDLKILQNSGKFITSLHVSGSIYKLDAKKEMVLFRMLQEAMNNAIKHSSAKNIDVELHYHPTIFRLIINDNGIGFNPQTLEASKTGIGLKSMQNRITMIGGKLQLHSSTENGTHLSFELENPNSHI